MSIELLTLDAVATFVAVAEELHFTRAAARLHVAQPALTKRIQQLERTLGLTLFVRTRRAVRLSAEGEALLADARTLLGAAAGFGAAVEALRHGGTRRIRVGFTPSAPHHVLPVIIRAFRRAHPQITCILSEAGSDDQLQQLQDDGLDVGIVRPPVRRPKTLVCTTFLEEPFVVVLPTTHPLCRQRTLSLAELAGQPLVLVSRRSAAAIHDQILGACAAAGFVPQVAQEASQIHAVVALVAAECGVSILPRSAASAGVAGAVTRPLQPSTLQTVMAVAYARRHRHLPLVREFAETAVKAFNER